MSTEIVKASPAPGGALSLGPMTPHEAWLFAESLSRTSLLPDAYRNNPSSILWALEYGRALGLDVVTTICTIHVIKGKPSQSADLMLGRARAAGHRVRINSERDRCVVSIIRADDPEFETTVEWTLDDAVTAGLCTLKPNGRPHSRSQKDEPQSWEKYPRAMLRARAVSEAVREACPEVLHGAIYTPEELGAYVDQDGNPIDAPVQQLRVVQSQTVPDRPTTVELEPAVRAQEIADDAAKATYRDEVRVCWARGTEYRVKELTVTAPDTKEPEVLGAYLTRRLQELPEQAPATGDKQDVIEVTDHELALASASGYPAVEQEASAEIERRNALDRLRAAASAVGLTPADLDEGFKAQYGRPTSEGTPDELRAMTATLQRGAA